MNLGQLLANAARRSPDAPAVTYLGHTRSYAELDARVDALAHGLADLGVRAGDRVGVLMQNSPELLETMFACFRAGLCWVPLNARFTAAEVQYQLQDCAAAALVSGADTREVVDGADLGDVRLLAVGDQVPAGAVRYEHVVDAARGRGSAAAPVHRDTLAWLFYTSGTTGRPKGAMLTHGVLDFVTASWLADLTPMEEGDVTLHAAPLTHGAGFHALATTARGGHHVLADPGRFEPAAVLELMAREHVTNTWLVPTQITLLVDALGATPLELPELQRVVYGGAPFPPAELRRAVDVFGARLVQLYGQGETPMTATVLSPTAHTAAVAGGTDRLASAGVTRPGMDVRVFGPDDVELPPGEVGEVVVQGPAVMLGYWQREDATRETLRGGWLHTGDLGRMDEQGYLYLLDRAKDLIITGGSNVYAVEVEAVLVEHPDVRDVAVVGVPDRTWGELVTAVVVTDRPADELEPELVAHCTVALGSYKRPRLYRFVDALPRNATGKILKRELRDRLSAVG
jgi:long-chain acyl-CoA synthetase